MICDECFKVIPYKARYYARYRPRDQQNFCSKECLLRFMTMNGDIAQETNYESPDKEAQLVTFYLSSSTPNDEIDRLKRRLSEDDCDIFWWDDGFTFDVSSDMAAHIRIVLSYWNLDFCTN